MKVQKSKHTSIQYRSFKHFNETLFHEDLSKSPFGIIDYCSDPNQSLHLLYEILNSVLTKHAPIKEKRVKHVIQPAWFDNDIKEAIRTRDELHNNKQYDKYKVQRNRVINMIKKSKKNFYNRAINENKNTSYLWKNMNSITNANKKHGDGKIIPDILKTENGLITDHLSIMNELNKYFVNISDIINKTELIKDNFDTLQSALNRKLGNAEFNLNYITAYEVKTYIDKLNPNKSTGLDGIGPRILKHWGIIFRQE